MYHVLYRKEASDIFGSEHGNTYVTITTDRKLYFLFLGFEYRTLCQRICGTSNPSQIPTLVKDWEKQSGKIDWLNIIT